MATSHNLTDAGPNHKMWRIWLTHRQTKILDSEVVLKADFSWLLGIFFCIQLQDFASDLLTSILDVTVLRASEG